MTLNKASLRDLPMDVIQFEIFPYLDGISSLHANDIFRGDLDYRCPNKIPKDVILKHQMFIAIKMLKDILDNAYRLSSTPYRYTIKPIGVIKLLKSLLSGNYDIIAEYNYNFHQMLINKVNEFINPYSHQYTKVSKGWKKGIMMLAQRLHSKIPNYKRQIDAEPISYYGKNTN